MNYTGLMKFIEFLDCRPQEFGATYNAFLSYVHPDDRDYVDNSFNRSFKRKTLSALIIGLS